MIDKLLFKIIKYCGTVFWIQRVICSLTGWKYCVGYDISNGIIGKIYMIVHKKYGVYVYAQTWSGYKSNCI